MSQHSLQQHKSRPKEIANRVLRLEPLEPRLTLSAHYLGLSDAALAAYVRSLARDGSINRADMIAILRDVQHQPDGIVSAADLKNLRKIVGNATPLHMPNYVAVLAGDVVNGNRANALYQGAALGNLVAGDSGVKLGKLTDKWFYGTDLPTLPTPASGPGYAYATASGTLYAAAGPSHLDEKQGALGDCYLNLSALGSVADNLKASIRNMFIANGDDTWTVRFYYNAKADYVTVDRNLPIDVDNTLVFQGYGWDYSNPNNALWLSLLEKAYAQWNETGKTGQGTATNSYEAIAGGWMGNVYRQALGYAATYSLSTSASNARTSLISSVNYHRAVTIGTNEETDLAGTGLHGNHAYNVLSYNASNGTFTLYNPWGTDQPGPLTWAQLRANTNQFATTANVATFMDGWHARSVLVLSSTAVTMTASTLDLPAAPVQADPSPTRAIDAVLAHWDVRRGDALRQSATAQAGRTWVSDVAARSAARSSAAFADIDALFDSVQSHAALAL